MRSVARYVCSETATPSTGAAPCKREAVLTTSPVTIPSPCSGRAPSATTASPVLIPTRTCSESAGSASLSSAIASRIAQPCPDSPLGVVLVRHRRAEHRHHRIADELLDRAAVTLDLLAQAGVVGADPRPHVLRVGGVGRSREADEVAEQHGDDLPLLRRLGGGAVVGERRAAERAERKLAGSSLPQAAT